MEFRKISLNDIDIIGSYLTKDAGQGEMSCDLSFINLLIWQEKYGNSYAVAEGQLLMRTGAYGSHAFALPFGSDMEKGIYLIERYVKDSTPGKHPVFITQEGRRMDTFRSLYSDKYSEEENRNEFDYVYLQSKLAELTGRKYHEKRNHIASFSRDHEWKYTRMTPDMTDSVWRCAEEWYSENSDRLDVHMNTERNGIRVLLDNADRLSVTGGCILVGERMVAFTLGAPINPDVYDIHIEKALSDYSDAYTVINREFAARELAAYKYINREDDMGLEGLRKAKLSYLPELMVKKYLCRHKESAI